MRIKKKRFAGRSFRAVQILPVLSRLKQFVIFAVPSGLIFYFYVYKYVETEKQAVWYLMTLVSILLLLFAVSRIAQRLIVYVDPEDKNFVVVKSGLVRNRERVNTPTSEIKGVTTETKVVHEKSKESGDLVRRTRTALVVQTGKGARKLHTYHKAATAQKAARLIEELLRS
jgi:hypothetical protein